MIPLVILNALTAIDKGLFAEPFHNQDGEWIKVKHKDDRTGLVRDVFKVRTLDHKTLNRIRYEVDWEAMIKHPDPEMLAKYYEKIEQQEKAAKELKRMGFVMNFKDRIKRKFEPYRQNRTLEERKVIKRSVEKHEFLNPKQIKVYYKSGG
jgi:hypothetical protein